MAPSTPPPPSNVVLAAFTIASTASLVISPRTMSILLSILLFTALLSQRESGVSVFQGGSAAPSGDVKLMRLRRHYLASSKGLLDPPLRLGIAVTCFHG